MRPTSQEPLCQVPPASGVVGVPEKGGPRKRGSPSSPGPVDPSPPPPAPPPSPSIRGARPHSLTPHKLLPDFGRVWGVGVSSSQEPTFLSQHPQILNLRHSPFCCCCCLSLQLCPPGRWDCIWGWGAPTPPPLCTCPPPAPCPAFGVSRSLPSPPRNTAFLGVGPRTAFLKRGCVRAGTNCLSLLVTFLDRSLTRRARSPLQRLGFFGHFPHFLFLHSSPLFLSTPSSPHIPGFEGDPGSAPRLFHARHPRVCALARARPQLPYLDRSGSERKV